MQDRGKHKAITAVWGIVFLAMATWPGGGIASAWGASATEQLPQDILDAQQESNTVCTLIDPYNEPPVVVIGATATESERYAAEELSSHLTKITGQDIEIVEDDTVPAGRKLIAVGKSRITDSYDIASLGVEQYIIDIKPDGIAIVGGRREPVTSADGQTYVRDRGTLYGVYEFLERLGVRWYRPEPWGWHIPKMETIELAVSKTVSDPPDFIGRSAVRPLPRLRLSDPAQPARLHNEQQLTEVWSARQRLNIRSSDDNRYGGVVSQIPNWHTHSRVIVPASRYLESHPEYFALIDGERGNPGTGRTPQLCLGNPDLQKVFAENVIRLAEDNPQWYLVAVDPEDGTQLGTRMCTCELCKAMDDPQHPQLMSNRVFAFTNIIAAKLARERPGALVGLYAYSMHTRPPTLIDRLEPNVVVALANINQWGDWTKKLFDPSSPQNARFIELMGDWGDISPHKLWMREYSAYGWLGPIPMYRILQDRVRSYRELGVEGLVWPGEPNRGSQFLLLYLKAQLQWNPDLDLEKELDLFYRNYYGPAAKPMKAYYESWMHAFENSSIGSGINGGISSGGRGMHMLCSPALMDELGQYLQEASALVDGEPLYERRLAGTRAGYEVSRRIGHILSLKMKWGESTPRPRGASGSYLYTDKAYQAWEDFEQWLLEANQDDLNFDIASKHGKPDATALIYMKRDVLENGRYSYWDERVLLKEQGFGGDGHD